MGCASKKTLIMPDESEEDYDEIERGWGEEFEPEGYQEERLVKNLVVNDWMLNGAQRRIMEAEVAVGEEGLLRSAGSSKLGFVLRSKFVTQL